MAISGTKREGTGEYVRKVGLGLCETLIFNPTKKELEDLLEKKIEKDPNYIIHDEGKKLVNIDIWVREVTTKQIRKIHMLALSDEVGKIVSGDKTMQRYVDKAGNTSFWVVGETKIPKFMLENSPTPARKGEVELYKFLRAFQGELKIINDFTIDWNRIMKGDVSELNSLRKSDFVSNVLSVFTVRVAFNGNQITRYENIFNKSFLPGSFMYYFRQGRLDANNKLIQFIKEVTDSSHGCLDFFGANRQLRELHNYVPEENPLEQQSVIIPEDVLNIDSSVPDVSHNDALSDDFDVTFDTEQFNIDTDY